MANVSEPEIEYGTEHKGAVPPCPDWWANAFVEVAYRSMGDTKATTLPWTFSKAMPIILDNWISELAKLEEDIYGLYMV